MCVHTCMYVLSFIYVKREADGDTFDGGRLRIVGSVFAFGFAPFFSAQVRQRRDGCM